MSAPPATALPSVVVVGGGLAGLAAAVALAESKCQVQVFESRATLGGRAASFRDPLSGQWVDHCQHVGMRCCTNLGDFCRRTGSLHLLRHDRTLYFIGPDTIPRRVQASRWLPAPFHLLPSFMRLNYLSLRDRLGVARATARLMRIGADQAARLTVGDWLRNERQSPQAICLFWKVLLVSALGEDLETASLTAARKVIVDGFLASRTSYELEIPLVPLGELYGARLQAWLVDRRVQVHLSSVVRSIDHHGAPRVRLSDGRCITADFVVLAVPWNRVADVVDPAIAARWPWLSSLSAWPASPITGVHLWFDREIMAQPHSVLVGRLSQWVFNRGCRSEADGAAGHYYQVVISASHDLAGRPRQDVVTQVCQELAEIWPAARLAELLHARVVTESAAVISPGPGLELLRPEQTTPTAGIVLAGDWTATGWPATMESAVRSGYLAAEAVLRAIGQPQRWLIDELRPGWLARRLIRS